MNDNKNNNHTNTCYDCLGCTQVTRAKCHTCHRPWCPNCYIKMVDCFFEYEDIKNRCEYCDAFSCPRIYDHDIPMPMYMDSYCSIKKDLHYGMCVLCDDFCYVVANDKSMCEQPYKKEKKQIIQTLRNMHEAALKNLSRRDMVLKIESTPRNNS